MPVLYYEIKIHCVCERIDTSLYELCFLYRSRKWRFQTGIQRLSSVPVLSPWFCSDIQYTSTVAPAYIGCTHVHASRCVTSFEHTTRDRLSAVRFPIGSFPSALNEVALRASFPKQLSAPLVKKLAPRSVIALNKGLSTGGDPINIYAYDARSYVISRWWNVGTLSV